MPRENLQNKKFSHLTVLELDVEKTKATGRTHWICQCDCDDHTILSVGASNLKRGNSTKCKYCKAENLKGQKFNQLLVIKRVIDERDHVKWMCLCDCGNTITVRPDSLKSGHTQSCGCLQKKVVSQISSKDLTGQRFGKLVVRQRSNKKSSSGQYYWFCDCDCGTKNKEISGHNLVTRGTESCGCIRSRGEEKISRIFNQNNIKFIREYSTPDFQFSSGKPAFFDFAVLNEDNTIKYFVEYQGEQHYQPRGALFTEEMVKEIQERDHLKYQYCQSKGIPIIYISYTQYNNLTLKDLII